MADLAQIVKPEDIERLATASGLSLTGGSFLWSWLGSNTPAITSMCAIIGVALTAVGIGYNIWRTRK